jgi:hypothetical protein
MTSTSREKKERERNRQLIKTEIIHEKIKIVVIEVFVVPHDDVVVVVVVVVVDEDNGDDLRVVKEDTQNWQSPQQSITTLTHTKSTARPVNNQE